MASSGWIKGVCLALACAVAQPAAAQQTLLDGETPDMFEDIYTYVCPDGGYESGCDSEDVRDAVRIAEDHPADIESRCLYQTEARCYPVAFGRIITVEQGTPLTWQQMVIFPKDGPRVEMLVIAEGVTVADIYVLVAAQTEGWFAPPQLVGNSNELMLLHAPGRTAGNGNADIVLARHDQGWTTFDVNDLLDEASALLPQGFSLAGGVNFDFHEMFVAAPVKRASDGGCCATGGTAFVDLAMPAGNLMEVAAVRFNETQPVATHDLKGENSDPE